MVNIIDGRCGCRACTERTMDMYQMVGDCLNCKAGPFLILYRAGDPVYDQNCPACGNWRSVDRTGQRRATPDEIPVAFSG